MTNLDVTGIGNAIVDVLAFCEENTISALGLAKGGMMLVDETRAESLYAQMGSAAECSGGSAANTLAGIASLGGSCAFIGKVKNDQLGTIFRHDLTSIGVRFTAQAALSGPATARCLIFVTPDGERTMNTFLGACTEVTAADIDTSLIEQAQITYIEGYLWDPPAAKEAIRIALKAAKNAGRKVAFTLSDTFCVHRHRAEFLELLNGDIDILFANESEIMALFETEDFDDAIAQIRGRCEIAAITRSEKGSVVVTRDRTETVATTPVKQVVDTTGAGDLYAAGFLFGLTRGMELRACAALGNRCAGQIIQQLGARSQHPLTALVA